MTPDPKALNRDSKGVRGLPLLLRHLWPPGQAALKLRVVIAMFCLITAKLIGALLPVVYKDLVNALNTPQKDELLLGSLIAVYGLAKFGQTAFSELRDWLFVNVTQFAKRTLGLETFRNLHELSLRYHLERQTGGLSRIIERGTSGIQFFLSFMLFNIIPSCLELIFVCGLLAYYFEPIFAAVTFFTVVLYIAYTLAITEWRLKYRKVMNEKDELANTRAIDSLLNYETVKYFSNEEHEYKNFDQALRSYETSAVQSQSSLALLNCGQSAIVAAGTIAVLYLAYRGVVGGVLDIGDFVMINTYILQLFMPLSFLGFVYRQMKQSMVDMDKMFEVKSEPTEIFDAPTAKPLSVDGGGISFKGVSFAYQPERPLLTNFNLDIGAGQTVAIVGESGSGKSTLVRLLFRFYEVNAGQICIDGQDIKHVTQASLRAQIGIVPQDAVLFNATIRYNLLYGRLSASEQELEAATRLAQIDRLIAQLPAGMESKVGERGLKLSGGEKQRVAIARTILKNPPILILDEASSALDTKTEKDIEKALQRLTKNRTTIIIAHRLSTVVNADKIIVLKAGHIVESGRHEALLAQEGEYQRMWQRQKEVAVFQEKLQEVLGSSPGS